MLPYSFKLENLDEGIKDLVVTINRIPEIDTQTTCEGHIWRDCPCWPTKDGWIHFSKPADKYVDLISIIKQFTETYPFFELEEWREYNHNTIVAHFESHDNGALFNRIDARQQRNYFRRAETRKKNILKGWKNLNNLIANYIRENISQNIESLPYQDTEKLIIPPMGFCCRD